MEVMNLRYIDTIISRIRKYFDPGAGGGQWESDREGTGRGFKEEAG